jgi:hypothetical protein
MNNNKLLNTVLEAKKYASQGLYVLPASSEEKTGPTNVMIGNDHLVRYRPSALDEYLQDCVHVSKPLIEKDSSHGNKENRSEFSNSQDRKYCISVAEYPRWVVSKTDKKKFLTLVQLGQPGWTKVNLKQKLKNECNWKPFLSSFHQNVGFLDGKNYPNIKAKTDGIKSDFIFLDFDNCYTNEKGEKIRLTEGYLSYDDALTILENSGFNYVLSTSSSHEVNHHKLHILIPTLKPIDSRELYKHYFDEVKKLFAAYVVDEAVSSIANNKFGGDPSKIKADVEFSKKDFHLDNVNLCTRKFLKKTSQAYTTKLMLTMLGGELESIPKAIQGRVQFNLLRIKQSRQVQVCPMDQYSFAQQPKF